MTDKNRTTMQEKPLDQLLSAADQSLCPPATTISGSRVRELARQQSVRTRRQQIVTGAVMVLLVGSFLWLWQRQGAEAPAVAGFNPEQVAAEVVQLRAERELLQQQLQLLVAERRLQRLQHELEMTRRFTVSATAIQQSNATAWSVLLNMSDWQRRLITAHEREQLERLVRSFPETTAESVARNMLASNEVSDVLYEN